MPNITHPIDAAASNVPGAGVWRDIARLAAEAVAIGLAFSVLLALAVFMVTRDAGNGDALPAHAAPPAARTM